MCGLWGPSFLPFGQHQTKLGQIWPSGSNLGRISPGSASNNAGATFLAHVVNLLVSRFPAATNLSTMRRLPCVYDLAVLRVRFGGTLKVQGPRGSGPTCAHPGVRSGFVRARPRPPPMAVRLRLVKARSAIAPARQPASASGGASRRGVGARRRRRGARELWGGLGGPGPLRKVLLSAVCASLNRADTTSPDPESLGAQSKEDGRPRARGRAARAARHGAAAPNVSRARVREVPRA